MLLSIMHSSDHPNARLRLCAQVHFREEHSEGSADFVASRESQILGVLPAFGQSSPRSLRGGNLVLNGGSDQMYPVVAAGNHAETRHLGFSQVALTADCITHPNLAAGLRLEAM